MGAKSSNAWNVGGGLVQTATMSDCSRTSYYRGCTYAWRFS
jgi:hypothetical protein